MCQLSGISKAGTKQNRTRIVDCCFYSTGSSFECIAKSRTCGFERQDFVSFFFFNKFIYFIFGCVGSSLLRVGFSLVAASRGYSSLQCAGFSLRWLLWLCSTGSKHMGFIVVAHRLSSCGAQV